MFRCVREEIPASVCREGEIERETGTGLFSFTSVRGEEFVGRNQSVREIWSASVTRFSDLTMTESLKNRPSISSVVLWHAFLGANEGSARDEIDMEREVIIVGNSLNFSRLPSLFLRLWESKKSYVKGE